MFEAGADAGGRPGEFQYWVEREKLTQVHPFPQGYRDLRTNADGSVLGVVTGVGTAKSAATIMALGLDPRFDLSQSYWLVAGIAGIDPADGSAWVRPCGRNGWWTATSGTRSTRGRSRSVERPGYIPLRRRSPTNYRPTGAKAKPTGSRLAWWSGPIN